MFKSYFLSLSLLVGILFSSIAIGKDYKLIMEKSFDVSQNQNLKLACDAGDVRVTTWDRNEVLIQIYGNKRAERNFKFDVSQNGAEITLEADRKFGSWFHIFSSESVKYKIKAPKKFNITGKTSGGDIFIADLNGTIDIHTSGGDIDIKRSEGAISTHTSGGDIQLKDCKGAAELKTSGGDIICMQLSGDLEAKTSGGDIAAKSISGKVECYTSGGDIDIAIIDENRGIYASTSGGDISIKIDSSTHANINFRALGGDIYNKLHGLVVDEVSSSKLIGKLNHGGNLIKGKTSGGDISLAYN